MSRDDIAKALGEARKEITEVRRDLSEFRREFEMPRVEVAAAEMPKVDLAKIDLAKVSKDARKMSKDAVKLSKDARKSARQAAQKAGLVRGSSRIPFVLIGLATIGLVAWAFATPGVKARVKEAARQARERMEERRAAWQLDEETRAFDAAEPAGVTSSAYAGSIDPAGSPFTEPPTGLPERLGDNGAHKIESDQPARA